MIYDTQQVQNLVENGFASVFHRQFAFGFTFSGSDINFTWRKIKKNVESPLVSRPFGDGTRRLMVLVRINSWNFWELSVCVRTSLKLPRIKVESCLGWLRPKACSNT